MIIQTAKHYFSAYSSWLCEMLACQNEFPQSELYILLHASLSRNILVLAGMRQSQSTVSLNQLQIRGPQQQTTGAPNKLHVFGMSRNGAGSSAGRTPIRRAFRCPVFWHAITLEVPANMTESCQPGQTKSQQFSSSLSRTARNPARTQLELWLDLRERNALPVDVLFSSSPSLSLLPPWKNSQVLGSVRIPLTQRIWDYFLHESEQVHAQRETTSNGEANNKTEALDNEEDTMTELKPRELRFVRRLEIPYQVI